VGRGITIRYERGMEFRDPSSGETWLDFAEGGVAAWARRARDGRPLDPAWQDRFDISRRERVIAIGAVSKAPAWAILTSRVRLYL
jgi:hypothetical protein